MKYAAAIALLLVACGGSSSNAPAQQVRQKVDVGLVAFVGDSITQLWPLGDYVVNSINAGSSGEESGQMLRRFQNVVDAKPLTVVILAGTNDIRHLDSADPANLFAMVKMARDAGIRVIVGTVPPMDINMGAYPAVEKELVIVLNDKIRKGAVEHGYEVVDYHAAFLLSGGTMNLGLYADAYLHPNSAGYDAMWAVLEPALTHTK